jgi:hypothetical protein
MKLSILIPTVIERADRFAELYPELSAQAHINNVYNENKVEVLFIRDNKEISIGKKRQQLLEMAQGEYIVFFDDDDFPEAYYISEIIDALKQNPDSVGFKIKMTTNGTHHKLCCHRFKYKNWAENIDGFDYVRGITHFNPVLRKYALQAGFKDMRFGEDKDYSDRLMQLVQNELYIDKVLFHYRYSNQTEHNKKYGIR